MNPPIVIPIGVDEDVLQEWIADTERMTGARITVDRQYLVNCENESVREAMALLFGGPEVLLSRKSKKNGKSVLKDAPKRELKSWRLMNGLELVATLTNSELDARLAAGDLADDAILKHPKLGNRRVVRDGAAQKLEPVE